MQVDPINLALKGAKTKRVKQKYHRLLSNFSFKFNLRHYSMVSAEREYTDDVVRQAGAHTRPLFSST